MARITEVSFELNGSTYKLSLDFDDAALVDEVVAFDITAERSGGKSGAHAVTARVEITPGQDKVVIKIADQVVFETDVFDHGPTQVEQFIQALPAVAFGGDPVLGCAVKAGLSAVVGQSIDCTRSLEANLRWRLFPEFLRCMTQHFGKMSKVAMFRAIRCILGADGA